MDPRAGIIRPVSEVTRILDSIAQGDSKAAEKLLPLVYEGLRRVWEAGYTLAYSTVTLLARLRGLSTSQPRSTAQW